MFDTYSTQVVAREGLQTQALLSSVPAAFAEAPDAARTSKHYTFISTSVILNALIDAGFQPTRARQAGARAGGSLTHAKHLIRFSYVKSTLTLEEVIPELILINAHNATAAYTLRAGLYRPLCCNGLMTPMGDFGLVHVPHRGNIVHNVIEAALQIARGFDGVGETVKRMASRVLSAAEQGELAQAGLNLRYPLPEQHRPVTIDQLLEARRDADRGANLWLTYNVIQQNLIAGGVHGRSRTGRLSCTRPIRAIRDDVRINVGLWQAALNLLEA